MSKHSYLLRSAVFGALFISLSACKSEEKSDDGSDVQTSDAAATAAGDGAAGGGGSTPTSPGAADAGRGSLDAGGRDAATQGSRRRAMQECPAEVFFGLAPQTGTDCVAARGACTIGATTCECPEQTRKWVCWNDSQCPSEAPGEGASCPLLSMECDYTVGADDDLDCECTAMGWDCGRQICPGAEPMAGSTCESGDGVCTFGARTCDCRQRTWICWNASDCPSAVPAPMTACPVQRMTCTYPNDECDCDDDGWECESHEEDEDDDSDERPANDGGAANRDAATPSSDASG